MARQWLPQRLFAAVIAACLLLLCHSYPAPVPMYFPNCTHGPLSKVPICDPSAPDSLRISSLLPLLSIDEKFNWLGNTVAAIPRLGLPAYQWWEEALHGVARSPGPTFDSLTPYSTQYPQPLNTASSFNRSLWLTVGQRIADEARAFSNANRSGLDYWTPNINIFRDPRWGRGRETPGEDPYLTSQYLRSMIAGLQVGEDARYLKVLATCKHYTAYDMEASDGVDRFSFDARVSDQDLQETFQPPFQACVQAGVLSIMCSFNAVNGVPMCANSYEINELLRGQWGFQGYITGDCGAVDNLAGQHWAPDDEHAVGLALRGGLDLDCGDAFHGAGVKAYNHSLVAMEDIDRALGRAFYGLLRTGWFDPSDDQFYRTIGIDHINSPQNQQLALEAAQQSIILLKNADGLLPLTAARLNIAVIGPNANATDVLWASYAGPAPYYITPLLAAQTYGGGQLNVLYAYGCDVQSNDTSGFAAAIEAATAADIVLFVGGNSNDQEGEYTDRASLDLPGQQWNLIQQLEKVAKKPLILTLLSSGPIDVTYARDSSMTGAVVWLGVPGQSGGTALLSALFGDYNPSGRLTMTVYPQSFADMVNVTDMNMRPDGKYNPGRTYKFYTGDPVYSFGHGLSYTTFNYSALDSTAELWALNIDLVQRLVAAADGSGSADVQVPLLSYHVNVTNTGSRAGSVSVLSFLTVSVDPALAPSPPLQQLVGFDRLYLEIGQTKRADFILTLDGLSSVLEDGSVWLLPGQYRVFIQNDRRVERTVEVRGEPWMVSEGRRRAPQAYEKMKRERGRTMTAQS